MICPICDHPESRVLDTRTHRRGEIRRRRECLQCKQRFMTSESLLVQLPHIIKKDGRREPYNQEKLRRGIQSACRKRPVNMAEIDTIVNQISKWVEKAGERELSAKAIGQAVIEKLRRLDDVAFVRFASVYKNFQDINEFVKSLGKESATERNREDA